MLRSQEDFREQDNIGPTVQDPPRRADGAGGGINADLLDGQHGAYYLARANHTGSQAASTISDFAEGVDDRVAALIQNGTGITWSYNDAGGTLTPTVTITQYTDEAVQDVVGALLAAGLGVAVSYNDAGAVETISTTTLARTVTATSIAVAATDQTLLCDATAAAQTINLPAAASSAGRVLAIKKIDVSVNTVTIDANASETIDGVTTRVLALQYASVTLQCDGATWWIT